MHNSASLSRDEDEIDLRQLFDTIMQHRWLGIAAACVVVLIGLAYLFLAPPVYSTNALVQVETKQSPIPGMADLSAALGSGDIQSESEMQIMQSRSVLLRVIHDLKLEIQAYPQHFPFIGKAFVRHDLGGWFSGYGGYAWDDETIDVGRLQVAENLLDQPLTLTYKGNGNYTLEDPDGHQLLDAKVGQSIDAQGDRPGIFVRAIKADAGTQFTLIRDRPQTVADRIKLHLGVAEQGKQTGIILLSYSGHDPRHITAVLTSIVNNYVRQNVDVNSEQASKSLDFLQKQLPGLKKQVADAEAALQTYKSKTGSAVDISTRGQAILQQGTDLETKISDLKIQRTELLLRFTKDSPAVQAVESQLAQLNAAGDKLEQELKKLPKTELTAIRLTRDVQVANELYVQLLNKAQEFRVAKAGTVGNARIVDLPMLPWKPVKPKPLLVLALTLVLAVFAGIAVIFLRVAFRRTLETPEDIEARLGLPVFATIPHSKFAVPVSRGNRVPGGALLAVTHPDEPAIESLRSLRTSLQFAALEATSNIVAIHGPTPEIGKSFVASNLARLLADAEKRVQLIDADLRKGHVHKVLGVQRRPGLSEVLAGSVTLEQANHVLEPDRAFFLSTGKLPPNPADLLTHQNFANLLKQLGHSNDYVIVDTPPTLNLADSIAIGKQAGINFMVVRAGKNSLQDLRIAQQRMEQNGIRIDGIIFNDLSVVASKYRYGGYYSYKYKPSKAAG